jgi:hypothetical protein
MRFGRNTPQIQAFSRELTGVKQKLNGMTQSPKTRQWAPGERLAVENKAGSCGNRPISGETNH